MYVQNISLETNIFMYQIKYISIVYAAMYKVQKASHITLFQPLFEVYFLKNKY